MYKFLQTLLLALMLAAVVRGQITETPVTVAPGRFLLEMDVLSLTLDREADTKYTAFGAATTFLTTGLTARLDLQIGAEFFITQKIDASGFTDRNSGIGDVYVRAKYRFYESETTYTMVAVMPYVKIPTNSGGVGKDEVEGGIIIPFHTELGGGFTLAAMAELDFFRNDDNDGYDSYWFASASLTRQVFKAVGFYAEAGVAKSSGGGDWGGTLGGGVTLAVTQSAWFDFAVYRGLNDGAADWAYVLRFNWSF
jgi:hypothetical protein